MASGIPQVTTNSSLGQFLVQINGFLQAQNEARLADWMVLEPPFNAQYGKMIDELKRSYPKGAEGALEEKCAQTLTVARDGVDGSPSWSQFTKFMVQYLSYLRDVDADPNKYLETYELLYELQKRANSALSHSQLGQLMLPVVVSCAKLICRLAIGLDKQPALIAHLKSASAAGGDDGPRETLPERAAEILRQGLTTCLNDRFSGLDSTGKPEGKKRGIYTIANICLKIFFQCRKTRNASMIFTNIGNLSPPLSAYPKSQRVTYLYYLGRFWFQNSHFYRAQSALQTAYEECSLNPVHVRQRRHILVYLIASNLTMGRFPSAALLRRDEARGLYERFGPLMQAIRTGNLALLHRHLDMNGAHADWFMHFRILLQLQNRCEVLVWRSLVRKTWILNGTRIDPNSKAAPLVDLNDLVKAFAFLSRQVEDTSYIDPDFQGAEISDEEQNESLQGSHTIESIISSLVDQGLLRGFIAHRQQKFVISGAKSAGGNVLAAGFPQPWRVIEKRVTDSRKQDRKPIDDVPGWKKAGGMGAGAPAGGMVFNLSGARPVGAA